MSAGATMEYRYGNKNNWRRRVWNAVREVTDNPRDSLVLFLAGREAADVAVAAAKGFRPVNMIAVERDPETLRHLRANGQLTIDGDLTGAMAAWPNTRPVSVVIADFCCGLSPVLAFELVTAWMTQPFYRATMVVNFLRGRDAASNEIRQGCIEWLSDLRRRLDELEDDMLDLHDGGAPIPLHYCRALTESDPKSRALHFFLMTAGLYFGERDPSLFQIEAMFAMQRPSIFSYRSTAGNQVFDTVVIAAPGRNLDSAGISGELADAIHAASIKTRPARGGVKQSISAILAHHTRRTQC